MQHRGSLVSSSLVLALVVCGCPASPATTTEATDTQATSSTSTGPGSTSTGTDAPTGTSTSTGSTGTPTEATSSDSTTGDPAAMTIYDVQQGKFTPGTVVTLKGVVVTSPIRVKGEKGIVFVEEVAGGEFSGIALELDATVIAALDAPPGSVVDFTGTYKEVFGNSQISVLAPADITVVGNDVIPAPAVVLAADVSTGGAKAENYEGVLVQIEDATVTKLVDVGFEVEGGAHVSDFFLGLAPKPKPGQIYPSITGPLLYIYDGFQIAPRSLDDLDDGIGDTTGDSTTGDSTTGDSTTGDSTTGDSTTGEPPVGIYAMQQGEYDLGDLVILDGVIATTGLILNKSGFYIEEPAGGPYSGIFVFVKNNAGLAVAPGDVLSLAGTYTEFKGLSELAVPSAASIEKTGNAAVPAPALVTTAEVGTGGAKSEAYEGVLITVQGVTVSAPVDAMNEFIVDGLLRIDDQFFTVANFPKPAIGAIYTSITGPLNSVDDIFKLEPRNANDLVK
ncbi:MAG: hypothetical protein H0T76_27230 [Nannocystis sp.]|nr:hypothetical protein [Nannocystis sp.]MBA3550186.1 hypothetical protein [Nannocystis sp.]